MLKLVTPAEVDWTLLCDIMDEWTAAGETIVPHSICRLDYRDRQRYLAGFEEEERGIPGCVPASTYFCLDTDCNLLVGAVNIRHFLDEVLLKRGGHIGVGIRPSQRRKGYATRMIALALEKCRELEIQRVLMTCSKENIGSAKSIQKNGGTLENEFAAEETIVQRYWIELN